MGEPIINKFLLFAPTLLEGAGPHSGLVVQPKRVRAGEKLFVEVFVGPGRAAATGATLTLKAFKRGGSYADADATTLLDGVAVYDAGRVRFSFHVTEEWSQEDQPMVQARIALTGGTAAARRYRAEAYVTAMPD